MKLTLLEKEYYTEREAIELLMLYSYSNGSEFETSVWKEREALKKNSSTHKAVLRKLKCLFDNVTCEGKESVRKYFLTGLKVQPLQDTGGNNGRPVVVESYLMDEYIFNQMLTVKSMNMARTHKHWVRELGLMQEFNYYSKSISNMLYKLHKDTRDSFQTSTIRKEFLTTLQDRNIKVVEKAFKRLEKAGRIEIMLVCNVKRLNDKYEVVPEDEFKIMTDSFNELLANHETTLFKYNKMKDKKEPTEQEAEIVQSIKNGLAFDDIDFFFKSYQVNIIDKTIHTPMTRKEYDTAYFDRLITLTEHRQNDYNKKHSDFFWQKYYKLNTFAILRQMGIQGLDKAIEEELNKRPVMAFEITNSLDLTEIF